MSLDLRIPMGLMFTLIGVILGAFGLKTNGSSIYQGIDGLNINLWWGLVLLAFGLTMFVLGQRGQKLSAKLPPEPSYPDQSRRGH